jgi:hypothetical protein
LADNLTTFFSEELLVEFNEFQERGRSGVIVTSLHCLVLLVVLINDLMDIGHVFSKGVSQLVSGKLNFAEEFGSDTDKSILRPGVEVINSSRSNKSGEHARSNTEFISDGGEAEVHVQVSLYLHEEVSE